MVPELDGTGLMAGSYAAAPLVFEIGLTEPACLRTGGRPGLHGLADAIVK